MTPYVLSSYDIITTNGSGDGELLFRRAKTFSTLTSAMLTVAFLANTYIFWATSRRHFRVRWDTFRLTLRYMSVVDSSLCAILALLVLRPWMCFFTGCDVTFVLQCTSFRLDNVLCCIACIVGGGVIVILRQIFMLISFYQEAELCRQHRSRIVKLVRDSIAIGLVCLVLTEFLIKMAPTFDLPLCVIFDTSRTLGIYLLLVPVAVNVCLGIFYVAWDPHHAIDPERSQFTEAVITDHSCKQATLVEPFPTTAVIEDTLIEVSDCRWKRFVIILNVAILTWFIIAVAMALSGVAMVQANINTLSTMTSLSTFGSVWSAYAILRYWT